MEEKASAMVSIRDGGLGISANNLLWLQNKIAAGQTR